MSPRFKRKPALGQRSTSKKTRDLYELYNWARDMVTWYWSADTLFWQVSITGVNDRWIIKIEMNKCYAFANLWRRFSTSVVSYFTYPIKDIPKLFSHRQFQGDLYFLPHPPTPQPLSYVLPRLAMLRYCHVWLAQCCHSVFCYNCCGFPSGKRLLIPSYVF